MHLMPNYLAALTKLGQYDELESFNVMSCVECGTCSYNCPGQVPIVQYIRKTKGIIQMKNRAKQAALAQSKADTNNKEKAKEGGEGK